MPEPAVDIIDVEPETGDLVPYEPPPAPNLFSPDPERALARMAELATPLADVIEKRRLYATIGGRRHITAEGWTTLGGMLGVVPVVCWTRLNETGDGYVARVEARTLDGRVVGAAESECSRVEQKWKNRDPYALRSMAQTRAIGRALRAPLGQIVVLAGYEPAGAEELPNRERDARQEPAAELHDPDPTADQLDEVRALLRTLGEIEPDGDWPERCRQRIGVPFDKMTEAVAAGLIAWLQGELAKQLEGADA